MSYRFTDGDLAQLEARGISPDRGAGYLETFTRGLPYSVLDRACVVGDGIIVLKADDIHRYSVKGQEAARSGRLMKFVPASGAATRMFQSLFTARERAGSGARQLDDLRGTPEYEPLKTFLSNIGRFAFFPELRERMGSDGKVIESLAHDGAFPDILSYLLTTHGLGYGSLPKGLIKFHLYGDYGRTPMEEHLVEAIAYVMDRNNACRLHFTLSEEHRNLARAHIEAVRRKYETGGIRFEVGFSVQQASTDTLAADGKNEPFRTADGNMVFRPGGHGALLENLNELGGDIVLIKNIDNVLPDRLKEPTILYKKVLCGVLVDLQAELFECLKQLDARRDDDSLVQDALEFARTKLSVVPPDGMDAADRSRRFRFIWEKLNRPLRVCGMVRASGEPGGGPFWVRASDGTCSRQIVESSEVNMQDDTQQAIFGSSTHFNPVDLACGLRDFRGDSFDLLAFRDPERAFISVKSMDGKPLKALEHPGLWNGGMSHWNTLFVEVSEGTFSPVKTVLDLLRSEHLPPE